MARCWEYLRVNRSRKVKGAVIRSGSIANPSSCEIEENKLGAEGWEVVTVVAYSSDDNSAGYITDEMWVFKRAVE
jgi:hypothetical protein